MRVFMRSVLVQKAERAFQSIEERGGRGTVREVRRLKAGAHVIEHRADPFVDLREQVRPLRHG
jgi:hypothetical protein